MSSSRTLQITYVGMKSQDVPIKSGTIKVMMKSDSEVLQEVVVTGMQKMDKRLFTGATKQLNADNVKLDGLPDISRGLEGRAAGVSVQNVSGTFGTAPKIRVRGATSIYGSSKPLWVVDGVILEDAIDVGPDDLSSGDDRYFCTLCTDIYDHISFRIFQIDTHGNGICNGCLYHKYAIFL